MVDIKVCGPGCMNCVKLYNMVQDVLIEKEIDGSVQKITDRNQITELGILLTPGLIINDKIISSGKVPTPSTLEHWILEAAKKHEDK